MTERRPHRPRVASRTSGGSADEIASNASVRALLRIYAETLDALRASGVVRSSNNPVCDYAEWLVAKALRLQLVTKSTKGFDATDPKGKRYQIKSRRSTRYNGSRQLGVIRNLDDSPFDYVVAVIFDERFDLECAYRVPVTAVQNHATYRPHVNGHVLVLRGAILDHPGVQDITAVLELAHDGGASTRPLSRRSAPRRRVAAGDTVLSAFQCWSDARRRRR